MESRLSSRAFGRQLLEPNGGQSILFVFNHSNFQGLGTKSGRYEQRLSGRCTGRHARFESLIQNALVCSVHIDDHQALGILREDINAMQLSDGKAQRRQIGGLLGAGHSVRKAGCGGRRVR